MEANTMRAEFLLRYGNNFGSNKTFDDREITSFLNKAQHEFVVNRLAPWKNRPQLGLGDHPIRNDELSGLLTATHAVKRINHLLGNEDNGGLLGPDLDVEDQDTERYGVFIGLPNEALHIISERVKTVKGDYIKPNTKVLKKTVMQYEDEIFDPNNNPGDNLTWSIDWGSYTTAENDGAGSYSNSSKSYSDSGTGHNMTGINHLGDATYIDSNRSVYLIPGKGWKIDEYTARYVKEPANINVDVQTPGLQINSQLPGAVHNEIVDLAVKYASASVVPEQSKYQVNQVESKEDQ